MTRSTKFNAAVVGMGDTSGLDPDAFKGVQVRLLSAARGNSLRVVKTLS